MTEAEKLQHPKNWRSWGPYLSDRQWGTVREDYSKNGDPWTASTHEMARSKAWRWGEEGIGGFSDEHQILCMAVSLWNGKDPFLKERFFGLTNEEGNHGEDVKEQYYYIDGVPSHSYMKMLYKYPQNAFPYQQLREENKKRSREEPEFELLDTDLFDHNEYFDVFIEFAKNHEHDLLLRYTVVNRAKEAATLHLLPTLWYRRTMGWEEKQDRPCITLADENALHLESKSIGDYYCYINGEAKWLFTENETNNEKLYGSANPSTYVKDGVNDFVVDGKTEAVNPKNRGTKAAAHFQLNIAGGETATVELRLCNDPVVHPFDGFDAIIRAQQQATDVFYDSLYRTKDADARMIQRQAWAGLLWCKQFYYYNIHEWLKGDEGQVPPPEKREHGRNNDWGHMIAADVISMPDKWEYPWFAAWDLAFQSIAFVSIDPDFAKNQLLVLLKSSYLHPNGELPAYEWNFSDVNPPVHALAAWRIYQSDAETTGQKDTAFLQKAFHKLLLNFTWWVNRIDQEGNNIFEGGFLGLDNVSIFDRSEPLPGGGRLEQSDGTSWMAAYSLQMLMIASELAETNKVYEDMATKFAEHFFYIAGSMANMANEEGRGLWDDEDEFYYDMMRMPDGSWQRLKLRSLVGLIPLIAVDVLSSRDLEKIPDFVAHMERFMAQRPDLANLVSHWEPEGEDSMHLLSLLRGHRMKCLFRRMLDEQEFLSDYGIRSLSKSYDKNPFRLKVDGEEKVVRYLPAESDSGMFGGNSNWRGPVWMPVNYLLVESMFRFHSYYGDDFKIEMPTGSGQYMTIREAADEIIRRLSALFLKDLSGNRPVNGRCKKHQDDPQFSPYMQFYEYFDGDTGRGLGASHQTGWTALIALLLKDHPITLIKEKR